MPRTVHFESLRGTERYKALKMFALFLKNCLIIGHGSEIVVSTVASGVLFAHFRIVDLVATN